MGEIENLFGRNSNVGIILNELSTKELIGSNNRPDKPLANDAGIKRNIKDDLLLGGFLLSTNNNEVGAPNPPNPSSNIQKEEARSDEFYPMGLVTIDNQGVIPAMTAYAIPIVTSLIITTARARVVNIFFPNAIMPLFDSDPSLIEYITARLSTWHGVLQPSDFPTKGFISPIGTETFAIFFVLVRSFGTWVNSLILLAQNQFL
ncbi:hypothetical protein SUGI_0368980 [Cryptomeria japonica]|nr:hypothetical protein SUGI_0368980 [Cryptomeria japonica]